MAAPVGNQNAKNAKRWADALNRALARASDGKGFEAGLDRIADVVVSQALEGSKEAWQEIGNRQDGKAAQAVTIAGDPEAPLQMKGVIELVKPK